MKTLTLELLEQHQKETIATLDKEIDIINEQINKLEMQKDKIIGVKARFITESIFSRINWIK